MTAAARRTTRRGGVGAGLAALLLWSALCPPAAAQQPGPVTAGREALRQSSLPWYDAQEDGLRRVSVAPPDDDFSGRHTNSKQPTPPRAATPNAVFSDTMQVLMWILAAVLLAVLVALLVWAFLRSMDESGGADGAKADAGPPVRVDRIEELPVPVDARRGDLLEQARAHFAAGNLRDAIVALYSYQLIQLDNFHAIHLERGKTNRQYLRELRGQQRLRQLLEGTMVAFEDAFFGNHQLAPHRVETCLGRVEEFQQVLRGLP